MWDMEFSRSISVLRKQITFWGKRSLSVIYLTYSSYFPPSLNHSFISADSSLAHLLQWKSPAEITPSIKLTGWLLSKTCRCVWNGFLLLAMSKKSIYPLCIQNDLSCQNIAAERTVFQLPRTSRWKVQLPWRNCQWCVRRKASKKPALCEEKLWETLEFFTGSATED